MVKGLACIKSLLLIGALVFPVLLHAQTAAEMDIIMGSSAITCSQAAMFVLSAAGEENPGFELAMEKGWLPKNSTADESISLGKLSLLMLKAFDIKGGLLFIIFPGQRYAFRTMVSRSYIQGAADPSMKVSGERFLRILGNVLNDTEGDS